MKRRFRRKPNMLSWAIALIWLCDKSSSVSLGSAKNTVEGIDWIWFRDRYNSFRFAVLTNTLDVSVDMLLLEASRMASEVRVLVTSAKFSSVKVFLDRSNFSSGGNLSMIVCGVFGVCAWRKTSVVAPLKLSNKIVSIFTFFRVQILPLTSMLHMVRKPREGEASRRAAAKNRYVFLERKRNVLIREMQS